MSRLMSVALTEQAVRDRRKTVTRRLGWTTLKPGTRLTLCRKVMGRRRPDGTVEPLVRLAEVEVVDVRREQLWHITDDDIVREGVDPEVFEEHYTDTGQPTPQAWIAWFCEQMDVRPDVVVTRIEWRYLDVETGAGTVADNERMCNGECIQAAPTDPCGPCEDAQYEHDTQAVVPGGGDTA